MTSASHSYIFFGSDLFQYTLRSLATKIGTPIAVCVGESSGIYSGSEAVVSFAAQKGVYVCRHHEEALQLASENGSRPIRVSAGYAKRLPTFTAEQKCINLHPSLLPHGRGPWPYAAPIRHGHNDTGVTLHQVTDEWDSGPILLQRRLAVDDNDTVDSLIIRSDFAAAEILAEYLCRPDYYDGQSRLQAEQCSYWSLPSETERTVDWSTSANNICRQIRSFGKASVFAQVEGVKYLIREAKKITLPIRPEPGRFVYRGRYEFVVGTADAFLLARFWEQLNEEDQRSLHEG